MAIGNINLFQLGGKGVNVVTAATHLMPDELTSAQNAEYVSAGGEGGLDQRPGMLRVNDTALDSIVAIHDVLSDMLTDHTPTLYAGMYSGSTHNWRYSTDGTTWVNADTPAKPFSNNTLIAGYFKDIPKAVTLGRKLYFVDGSAPITLHSFDGTTDVAISTVPPAVSGANLTTPTGAFAENYPFTGSTTYTYKVVATLGASYSAASSAFSVTTQAASLDSTHFNVIRITGTPVAGATTYDVYRTVGGASQGKIGTIPISAGAFTRPLGSSPAWETPAASTVTPTGTTGATTYTYKIVIRNVDSGGYSAASSGFSTSTGNATLSGSNFNRIAAPSGSYSTSDVYDIYRTAGGATQGLIGTQNTGLSFDDTGFAGDGATAPSAPVGQHFSDLAVTSSYIFWDAGLAGDAATPPSSASGATAGAAIGVLDMITDGSSIYLAILDQNNSDPTVYGRILQFSPTDESWLQIGATFPTASGNGGPSALVFYDGALSYGTYIGTTNGNTSYLTGTGNPLPAGGISEVHSTSASLATVCLATFNGVLYAGLVSHVAATAALVVKRVAGGTWSTSLTAGATAVQNAFTLLYVYNGLLFAGWTSGGGATAAIIKSTPDGITWTTEYTAAATDVPCQAVTFNGALYVVLGKTGVGYNTTSSIIKRTSTGTWSVVDDPSDALAGAIGIVYI